MTTNALPPNRASSVRLEPDLKEPAMNAIDSGIGYELSVTYPVSAERLFQALTNAAVLKDIWRVQQIEVDARVGGQTTAVFMTDGQDWSFTIT